MLKCLTALALVICVAGPALAQTPAPRQTTTSSGTTEVIVTAAPRPRPADNAPLPPLEWFTESPRVELIALSPDGSRFAYTTTKGGVRILTTYNVNEATPQFIRLADDPVTAITWLNNDYILLSDTLTGLRGMCPTTEGVNYKVMLAKLDPRTYFFRMGIAGAVPMPPPCASYGVRSQEAGTVVNLTTQAFTPVGQRMGDYNGMAYGLPLPVMTEGKMHLTGAFLEMRDKPGSGTVQQRVYLWRFDPDTGMGRLVDDKGGDLDRLGRYVDDWLLDKDGQPFARATYVYIGREFNIEVLKDGDWTPALTRHIDHTANVFAPSLVGLGRDGQSLLIIDAVTTADGERRFKYFELSRDGTLSEPLGVGDATRERPIFHPETGALAGLALEGDATTYTFFDPDLAEVYKYAVDTAPGKSVRVAAMGRDPAQMILFVQGGDDVGAWHYYDFTTGKRIDLGSQYPAVPDEWVASQRSVRYKAADGLEIGALMTLPPLGEAKNRPLVVLPHDGPLGHDRRGFDWLAQVLASRGYVVLQPNYRGSDGSGQAFTEAGYGEWSGRMLTDMADGVRYLAAEGIIDPDRVCIAGSGYGGYAALKGAQASGPYRCAIAINGIVDPQDYLNTARGIALADDIAALRADPANPRTFRADIHSPRLIQRYFGAEVPVAITAASVSAPVLLVHVDHNKIVPASQSRSLRDGLQAAGKPVSYTELTACGHTLDTDVCRLSAAQAVTDFLAVHNPAR